MSALKAPIASLRSEKGGVRAVVVALTKELAHQIHNEVMKLAQGRKWRTVLFSKATASTLSDKSVRSKVGMYPCILLKRLFTLCVQDIIVSTPLRLVDSLQNGTLELDKCVETNTIP